MAHDLEGKLYNINPFTFALNLVLMGDLSKFRNLSEGTGFFIPISIYETLQAILEIAATQQAAQYGLNR